MIKPFAIFCTAMMLVACSGGESLPADPQPPSPVPSLGVEAPQIDDTTIPVSEKLSEGQTMAEGMCAACHAIGPSGDSPHASAPPFHTLSERYPIASLAESFAEGIIVGHPDMPVFQFEPRNIDSLLAYIESVQPAEGR